MDENKTRESIKKMILTVRHELKNSPSAEDIAGSEEFIRRIRSLYATMTTMVGWMESKRSIMLAGVVDSQDEETYKRIKNSSTMSIMYSDSQDAELTSMYFTVKELIKLIQQTSDEYRTFISFRKQELSIMPQ